MIDFVFLGWIKKLVYSWNHPLISNYYSYFQGNSEEASSYLLRSQMIQQYGDLSTSSLNSCVNWINNGNPEQKDC
jgi:hypothetical protein